MAPLSVAYAQSSPPTAADNAGEIVVTAQKRQQNLQDIGVSVTAIGSEQLSILGRQDVTALANEVPNLEVNQYSPTITIFNIRGVSQNDFTDAQEAPIAFYQDEVYISSLGAISGMNFDLDRVEVLRGPQGTLFGRNATGGLVQFISAKPTDQEEGFLTTTFGSYGEVATEGAISGPITDTLRYRLSMTTENTDGYIQNLSGPEVGAKRFYAFRAQLAADPTPDDHLLFRLQVLRDDHGTNAGEYTWTAAAPNQLGLGTPISANSNPFATCNGCDVFGYRNPSNDPFTQNFGREPIFDRSYADLTIRYEHEFGWATLTSITDYQNMVKRYGEDSSMTPEVEFNYDTHQDFHQVSEELRLSGQTDQVNWVFGAYGMNIRSANAYQVYIPAFFGDLNYGGVQTTDTAATFSQVEYKIADQFSIIGGLRYSWDQKHLDYSNALNGVETFNLATSFPQLANLATETFQNWSGKAELDYKPEDGVLVYASVNRGTKSGGFGVLSNPGPFTAQMVQEIPFGQEVLTNYEGGVKLTLLDHKVHVNGSVFYYDYHGCVWR
jgi:iron complex outermembrane receptor protein